MTTPAFALAVVRARRIASGCSSTADTPPPCEVEFALSADGDSIANTSDFVTCGRLLINALATSSSTSTRLHNAFDPNNELSDKYYGHSDDSENGEDDEEEEIFNNAIGFRDMNLGHMGENGKSPLSTNKGADTAIFFHFPKDHDKFLGLVGVAVPDPRFQRNYYIQQEVRFLVLLSNVPFQALLRSKLQEIAVEFFKQDDTLVSYEPLAILYNQSLQGKIDFAELPYREIYVGLPIVSLVKRFGKDVVAILRVILLEGRIACYSANPSIASAATLALLALLPGVLATTTEFTSRTIQAVVYRLRRYGMPFSLFNEDFIHQPCFSSDQELIVYSTKGFLVGTNNSLLLKRPKAQLDLIVDLDTYQVVTFPTKKCEVAFAFGSATAAFADSITERFGRNVVMPLPHPSSTYDQEKTKQDESQCQKSVTGSPIASANSDIDWILAQFQRYFEHFLEEAFKGLFDNPGGVDANNDPWHPSIRALLEGLVSPAFGEHSKFYAEYGRAWTHAWQTTNNYDNWIAAHRLERRRSTIATAAPPPQEGRSTYTYQNGDEYEGDFVRGKRHGFGIYVEFVTKNQYEGDWRNDLRHGKGILSSKSNGYIYDGEWKDDVRCGRGHSSLKNVESYTGEWENNCFHGTGIYTNAQGDVYDGEWKASVKAGVGKLVVARPKRDEEFQGLKQYVGEWASGQFHGTGTAHYMDGTEYSGRFQDGKRHGNGLLTLPSGDSYEGQWWKGFRHGEGCSFSKKSGTTKEGTWRKDCEVDGKWFITYQNGDKYSGACRRGRPWGEGICKYANGSFYSGSWVDGLREGYGISVDVNGDILEGEWKNSVLVKTVRRPSQFVDVSLEESSLSLSRRRSSVVGSNQPQPVQGNHLHIYTNGDIYDGEFKNSMRDGFGVFTERATGNLYEGEWKQNLRHGSGVFTSGMKDFIYDGNWKHDMRDGYGHCVIRSCETYSGQWHNNQFHGMGKYIDAEGVVYEGEFEHGKKHGMGKQISTSSTTHKEQYCGEWKDGHRDGIGDAVFSDGSHYTGSWKNDMQDGEGTFTSAHGERYVGQWRMNMKEGAGTLYLVSSGVTKEGYWVADVPVDGDWTIQFPDGSKFTGQCVNGRAHGRGVCKYANGDVYDGMWVNGKRHGFGTGFFANGESFVGEWENNHVALNGKGTLTLADGTVHVYAK